MVRVRQTRNTPQNQARSMSTSSTLWNKTETFSEVTQKCLTKHGVNFSNLFSSEARCDTEMNPFTVCSETEDLVSSDDASFFHKCYVTCTTYPEILMSLSDICLTPCKKLSKSLCDIFSKMCSREWEYMFTQLYKSKCANDIFELVIHIWIQRSHNEKQNVFQTSVLNILEKAIIHNHIFFLETYCSILAKQSGSAGVILASFVKPFTEKNLLHLAVNFGNAVVVSVFVGIFFPLDAQDCHGKTALHYAVMQNSDDIVRILLEAGAEYNITDKKYYAPWMYAAESHCVPVLSLFESYLTDYLKVYETDPHDIVKVCRSGSVESLEHLRCMNKAVLLTTDPVTLNTPLIEAIGFANYKLAKYLLENECDVNSVNSEGMSALLCLLENPFYDTDVQNLANVLLTKGACINQKYPDGSGPLTRFSECSSKVLWLLNNGADPNHINSNGLNLLWCLCQRIAFQKFVLQKLLMKTNLDPCLVNTKVTFENGTSTTPIEECIRLGYIDTAYELYYMSVSFANMPTHMDNISRDFSNKLARKKDKLLLRIRRNRYRVQSLQRLCRGVIIRIMGKVGDGKPLKFNHLPLPQVLVNYVDSSKHRIKQEQLDDELELEQILLTPFYRDPYLSG